MSEIADLDKRLTVVETEMKHLKENLEEVKQHSKDTYGICFDLKSRADKQNGLLPHMAQDIKDLNGRFDTMEEKYLSRLSRPAVAPSGGSKYKWAAISAIVTAVLAVAIEVIRTFSGH